MNNAEKPSEQRNADERMADSIKQLAAGCVSLRFRTRSGSYVELLTKDMLIEEGAVIGQTKEREEIRIEVRDIVDVDPDEISGARIESEAIRKLKQDMLYEKED